MNFLDLNFDELLGLFFVFISLIYLTIVVFGGVMRIFDDFLDDGIKRIFHYHYHYKDRRGLLRRPKTLKK